MTTLSELGRMLIAVEEDGQVLQCGGEDGRWWDVKMGNYGLDTGGRVPYRLKPETWIWTIQIANQAEATTTFNVETEIDSFHEVKKTILKAFKEDA